MIRIGITPTFMLLRNSPLVQDSNYVQEYGLNFDLSDNLSRYFWTTDANPDNTFDVRYSRWERLIKLTYDLNYTIHAGMPVQKWADELASIKKIYDEKKPKKVYTLFPSK
jgi:hypothetical protein